MRILWSCKDHHGCEVECLDGRRNENESATVVRSTIYCMMCMTRYDDVDEACGDFFSKNCCAVVVHCCGDAKITFANCKL